MLRRSSPTQQRLAGRTAPCYFFDGACAPCNRTAWHSAPASPKGGLAALTAQRGSSSPADRGSAPS
eukprot:7496045-Pyramimonas_sp.AAC.1